MSATQTQPDFDTALQTWLDGFQKLIDKHYADFCKALTPPQVEVEVGKKFIRIIKVNDHRSAAAFIALEDSTTKSLGIVRKGDVLKPATWKRPEKTARGNIFDGQNGLGSMRWTGPAYLK